MSARKWRRVTHTFVAVDKPFDLSVSLCCWVLVHGILRLFTWCATTHVTPSVQGGVVKEPVYL